VSVINQVTIEQLEAFKTNQQAFQRLNHLFIEYMNKRSPNRIVSNQDIANCHRLLNALLCRALLNEVPTVQVGISLDALLRQRIIDKSAGNMPDEIKGEVKQFIKDFSAHTSINLPRDETRSLVKKAVHIIRDFLMRFK
jgi:hypothetical protein